MSEYVDLVQLIFELIFFPYRGSNFLVVFTMAGLVLICLSCLIRRLINL